MQKKLLLIMPRFFNYPNLISEELNNMGYQVDFFDDRPSTNAFIKAAIRINKNLIYTYIKKYFDGIMTKIKNEKYDVVFLISGQSLSFSESMIEQIKKSQPYAKFVLYQWDSQTNFPYIKKVQKYFDKCYSFDRRDVEENSSLMFLPLFYSKIYENIGKEKNKEYKLPLVIPIVLYTGKKRWDAKRYLEESQETLDGVEIKAGNYNLVDINDFTKEELLQEKTLISKMMLLEKSESTEESIEMLEKIIPNTNKEEKELLKRVISILFGEKIGEEKTKELIEKIDGGEEKMLALVDMIRNENQMYINIGKKEKCLEIAKNLLKINMPISQISEVTKMSKEEIAKIK